MLSDRVCVDCQEVYNNPDEPPDCNRRPNCPLMGKIGNLVERIVTKHVTEKLCSEWGRIYP